MREEFNRADNLNNEHKTTVGFALTILQRRLASSPEAIYQSLRRRRERLERQLAEGKLGKRAKEFYDTDFDEDDLSADEQKNFEQKVVDHASAAATIAELKAEIKTLKRLENMANDVRVRDVDRKWEELSRLLQDDGAMFDSNGNREKLIIFTEHRDSMNYLTDKIRSGKYIRKERFSGNMSRSFYVGENITQEDIHAKYEDGILRLTVPKKEEKKVEQKNYINIEG